MTKINKKADLKPVVDLTIKPSTYQPSKSEMEEEYDMPGLTMEQLRRTFGGPFNIKREAE